MKHPGINPNITKATKEACHVVILVVSLGSRDSEGYPGYPHMKTLINEKYSHPTFFPKSKGVMLSIL